MVVGFDAVDFPQLDILAVLCDYTVSETGLPGLREIHLSSGDDATLSGLEVVGVVLPRVAVGPQPWAE
jgi:hypothetical protein